LKKKSKMRVEVKMNMSYANLQEVWQEKPRDSENTSVVSSNSSNRTLVIGTKKANVPSRSVSPSPSYLTDRASPVSSLDSDDFEYQAETRFPRTHEFRVPEEVPSNVAGRPLIPIPNASVNTETDKKIMKHILKIQNGLDKIMNEDSQSTRLPLVETGLFISIGVFLLIVMNMILKMGKHHITYRFDAD
jgi:hypothetical protein